MIYHIRPWYKIPTFYDKTKSSNALKLSFKKSSTKPHCDVIVGGLLKVTKPWFKEGLGATGKNYSYSTSIIAFCSSKWMLKTHINVYNNAKYVKNSIDFHEVIIAMFTKPALVVNKNSSYINHRVDRYWFKRYLFTIWHYRASSLKFMLNCYSSLTPMLSLNNMGVRVPAQHNWLNCLLCSVTLMGSIGHG